MSLSKALARVVAPAALATLGLMSSQSAFAQQAKLAPQDPVDASCARIYDAKRGVMPGDCYQRSEMVKFVCLNPTPAKGSPEPACSVPGAQVAFYQMTRFGTSNVNMFTVGKSTITPGRNMVYNIEKGDGGYSVSYVVDKAHVMSPNHTAIPSWATPQGNKDIAEGKFVPAIAVKSCEKTGGLGADGCNDHAASLQRIYAAGSRLIFGGVAMEVNSSGKLYDTKAFVTLNASISNGGEVALTDKWGAARAQFAGTPPGNFFANNAAPYLETAN